MPSRWSMKYYYKWVSELKIGDIVRFSWTNCGYGFTTKAKITKINKKSIIGELEEKAGWAGHSYPVGHKIKVPRPSWDNHNWTWENTVDPVI